MDLLDPLLPLDQLLLLLCFRSVLLGRSGRLDPSGLLGHQFHQRRLLPLRRLLQLHHLFHLCHWPRLLQSLHQLRLCHRPRLLRLLHQLRLCHRLRSFLEIQWLPSDLQEW